MTTASNTAAGRAAEPAHQGGRTALTVFAERVAVAPSSAALRHKQGGTWRTISWTEWDQASSEIAAGLRSIGVETADRVVILSDTRYEWVLLDVGVLKAGAVVVPIYPSNTPEQCEYIINDAGSTIVIVENPHQLEKLFDPDVRPKIGAVKKVVLVEDFAHLERPDHKGRVRVELADVLPDDAADWILPLAELRAQGVKWAADNAGALDEIADGLDPDQAATFVYTSGTTGPPKGVVLTHKNIAFECGALQDLLGVGPDDEQLLFLPLAHSFARVLEWTSITVGATIAFAEGIPQLIQNLGEVRPTFMGAVPRVYEKAYAKIQANFAEKQKKTVARTIVNWALKQGRQRSENLRAGHPAGGLGVRLADKLVFEKVRSVFGGRIRFFVSGGAPLSAEIAEFFHAAGLLVLEGYGLTETTAASNVNRPDSYEFGTVGPAIPGVEIKIAEDGEVLIRGGNVMKEYYKQPEATAEAIDKDGWFHSGDIGEINARGHLRITDRKKDIIVTAGGKNVAPQNIENQLKAACPLVSQMMVYGDKRKYLSALITLGEEPLAEWAKGRGLTGDYATLTQAPQVHSEIQKQIERLNGELASYETIKKFKILDRDFDQATGELTPTLKVKRKFCSEKFKDLLEAFYGDDKASTL